MQIKLIQVFITRRMKIHSKRVSTSLEDTATRLTIDWNSANQTFNHFVKSILFQTVNSIISITCWYIIFLMDVQVTSKIIKEPIGRHSL